jgi:hypothetical protein
MLLHVSILRSSSGSLHCSLLKLYVKMLIHLLYLSVMLQHIVCTCICFTYPLQGCRSTGQSILDYYNITSHSLVCNKLSESIMHGALIKIINAINYLFTVYMTKLAIISQDGF